ncbi:transcription termination/antitermination protein NusG, partial [Enterobacter cloacae]
MSEAPKKRWYVVQAFSGFEGRVATSLREHIKLHNMEELFGEVMVPTE